MGKTIWLSFKLFCKTLILPAVFLAFFIYANQEWHSSSNGLMFYSWPPLNFLVSALKLSFPAFAFFLLLSYEYFHKLRAVRLEECVRAVRGGETRLFLGRFTVMAALVLLFALAAVVNVLLYPNTDPHDADFMGHMLSCVFLYLFLVPLFGALLGACVSLLTWKRAGAYPVLVLITVLCSPLPGLLSFLVMEVTSSRVDLAPLFDIFRFFPLDLDWTPLYAFGVSLLPYLFEALFFWVFACLALVCAKLLRHRPAARRAACLAMAALSAVNLLLFVQPSSRVDRSDRQNATKYSDDAYYRYGPEQTETAADFAFTRYELEIRVGNRLHVEARLTPDRGDLPVYRFTLYHNMKLRSVSDQDGSPLPFRQERDHVTVEAAGPLSAICLQYDGYSNRFYSNIQGIYLPGYFPYYPMPGHRQVYSVENQSFCVLKLPAAASFELTVRSPKRVFTNLSENADGSFSGEADALTLMSGYVDSTVSHGVEVIYPSFETLYTQEWIDGELQKLSDVLLADGNLEKIFIVPSLNQHSDQLASFSNHLTTKVLSLPASAYIQARLPEFKQELFTLVDHYMNQRDWFDHVVSEWETQVPEGTDKPYTLFVEKVGQLGEETVLEQTGIYLFDDQDTRSIMEFLSQLHAQGEDEHADHSESE